MADVINLRQARKVRTRAATDQDAAANRAKFGQSKAEKTQQATITRAAQRRLDQAKLEDEDQDGSA